MRVVIVNKFARVTGGADRYCLELAQALRERGHDVAFLSTARPDNVDTLGCFVACRVTSDSRDQLPPAQRVDVAARALWNPEAAAAARELLGKFRPDIVHAHKLYPQLSVAPVVEAARRSVPIVQTLHDYEFIGPDPFDAGGGVIDRTNVRLSYRLLNSAGYLVRKRLHAPRVAAWTACSRFVGKVHALKGIRATVIPNFVATHENSEDRGFDEREGIVFAGRLSEEKGVRDVVELARRAPSLRVSVAGLGPLEPVVRSAAAELPNFSYLGFLRGKHLDGALAAARVAVVPSRWEEPGVLAALEAMAAGTPLVAYARGGLAEYVGDASAGVLVAEQPEAFARACTDLHDDRERWHALAANARRAAGTVHSVATHVDRIVEVYERVTGLVDLGRPGPSREAC